MKNNLEELRKERGIKQEELADILKLSHQTIIFMFLDYTLPFIIGAGLLLIHIVSFLLFARHYDKLKLNY